MTDKNKVSISLHPQVLNNVIRMNPANAGQFALATNAFELAYQSITAVHEARSKAAKNHAWTDAKKILNTAALADKYMLKVTKAFDFASETINSQVLAIENQLTNSANKFPSRYASEIRAHLKSLSKSEGRQAISEAIENNDTETLVSVLGAPHYLSGLTKEEYVGFRHRYQEKYFPDLLLKLEQSKKALQLIDKNSVLIFAEFEKAVGASPKIVSQLRASNSEAEAALVVKSFTENTDLSAI